MIAFVSLACKQKVVAQNAVRTEAEVNTQGVSRQTTVSKIEKDDIETEDASHLVEIDTIVLQAKNTVASARKRSSAEVAIFSRDNFQKLISKKTTYELTEMSKDEWTTLVKDSLYQHENMSVRLIGYDELKKVFLPVELYKKHPHVNPSLKQTKVACSGESVGNIYFAAFESEYHYFIISHMKNERLRSSYPNWFACRKKDNVQVFSAWSSEFAIKLENGILTGEGFTTAGPEHKVSFTKQRGNKPALTFKSVDSIEPPLTTKYTIFFDSRGVFEIRPTPPSGNGVTTR